MSVNYYMMRVTIRCFGQIRSITNQQYVEMEVPANSSVLDILKIFAKQYGSTMEEMLFKKGQLRSFFSIQVDSKQVDPEEYNTLLVNDQQTIAIIPYIAGG